MNLTKLYVSINRLYLPPRPERGKNTQGWIYTANPEELRLCIYANPLGLTQGQELFTEGYEDESLITDTIKECLRAVIYRDKIHLAAALFLALLNNKPTRKATQQWLKLAEEVLCD